MITINNTLCSRKKELLGYFRNRASESLALICKTFAETEFRERASAINSAIMETRDNLIKALLQEARKEKWNNEVVLKCILMITYTQDVVMLESRNTVWPYDYMTFSRRIGELWEPFCKLCFDYSIKPLSIFIPPLFSEVKKKLTAEIEGYIDNLSITKEQKTELNKYYARVWGLVTSGEIKLELDLHFELNKEKIVVDFKSGFGSNEKGNTNRLLLVASIYKNLEENYRCVILVRSKENLNNNYFQTLKHSGVWDAYCGDEAYGKIYEITSFDIKKWIASNINWEDDFEKDAILHFKKQNLMKYLIW